MSTKIAITTAALVLLFSHFVRAEEDVFPGKKVSWHGFAMYENGGDKVVVPHEAAAGKPWVWRARFFGHEPQFDLAMLKRGYHVAYCDVAGLYGAPVAVERWNKFYETLTGEHGLAGKAILEGMSRGGLIIYNWAAANPEKVAAIYGDAPVMDFKSWPGAGNAELLKAYGFKNEEQARVYKGNPLDNLEPLAKAGIPIIHVVGDQDTVVPVAENTAVAEKRYKELGGVFEVIHKNVGHHPHSLKDPTPLVEFMLTHTGKKQASSALPRTTPEAEGVSSAAIADFISAADGEVNSMHSFMLLRHGKVVAEAWWEPESAEKPHILWSLSKSFTSTAVGLAVAEGKLSLDDPVLKFFPEEAPAEPSENLKAMRVRDLLTMNAGHQDELNWRAEKHWAKAFLSHPVPHKPGTHFQYNTPATYMLSAIVQKVTGETVLDYLTPRLFAPLGIEKPVWETSPQGISIGGYGLYLRTEDIAKFGQLYLQKGKWNGEQILPESWVEAATSKQVPNGSDPKSDWNQGYGFQFWRCRHNAYRGDGKDGQFCIVLPEQDAVIAITANTGNMQGVLNLVWEKILPAFEDEPLATNPAAQKKLQTVIGKLKATR